MADRRPAGEATTDDDGIVTAATGPSPQQQQQRGQISYFLFLSMLFFFMNSNSLPDTGAEDRLRGALVRLEHERDDFKEWLYPGSVPHRNATTSSSTTPLVSATISDTRAPAGSDATATSITSIADQLGGSPNAVPTNGSQRGQPDPVDDERPPFVLPDLTPPPVILGKVEQLLAPGHNAVYYRNISGFFKGAYVVHPSVNVSDGTRNSTEEQEHQGRFPWTGLSARKTREGRTVRLNVREAVPHVKDADVEKERKRAEVVMFRGSMTLELHDMLRDQSEGGGIEEETRSTELDMEGVHYLNNGSFFIHAAPPWKDLDMRELPGLMMSNSSRNSTAQTVLTELDARLERIRKVLASGQFPDNTGSEGDTRMNCTFSMYGQLRPLPPGTTQNDVREFEEELHTPTGRSVASLPRSKMDVVVYSRDCNLLFELDGMEGLEIDRFWSKATSYAAVLSVLTLLQTWVLVKQMEYTSTPTSLTKVAHLTIAMQVFMDVYFCVTHLTLGIVTDNRASLALLIPGFFGILSGLLFGLRYAATIRATTYRPQTAFVRPTAPAPAPERVAPPAVASAAPGGMSEAAPRRSSEMPNTSTPLLPRTPAAAAGQPAPEPVFDVAEYAERSKQFVIFAVSALAVVLVFAYIGWFPILMTAVYSFWIPQIYHTAERGSGRNALLKKYILGTTLSRLFIPVYVWACPDNLLFAETSLWVWLLVAYQLAQVATLLLQDTLGARFFLPRGFWFPELDTWDYHPVMPAPDLESADSGADGQGAGDVNCVICFEKIEVDGSGETKADDEQDGAGASGSGPVGDVVNASKRAANRMSYMVPPCHHLAHTTCLESWAAIKLECPLCRRPLPPF